MVLLLCLVVVGASYGQQPLLHLPEWGRQLTATVGFVSLSVFAVTGGIIIGFRVVDRRDRKR